MIRDLTFPRRFKQAPQAGLMLRSTRVDRVSQQHLTVVVHRLNEDLLLADGQVIEAVLSLAVPVLAMVFQVQGPKNTGKELTARAS